MRGSALEALREASALFAAGRLEEARRACRKLLAKRADVAEAHVLLGEIHRQFGEEPRARDATGRALKLRPGWTLAHVHLCIGDLLADFARHEDAEARYRVALNLDPGLGDARFNLAASLHAQGRPQEAIVELQALLARDASAADAREQLVHLLQAERRFDEMEAACREGMRTHPSASFYANKLGVALWWRGCYDEALAAYRGAAERAADLQELEAAKFLEASGLLAVGRYEEGWAAFHYRPTRRALGASLMHDPRALLTSSPRSVRIVAEQGLGDELFFLRFASALRARGHRIRVQCSPKLAPLLASMQATEEPDVTIASGDLPLASGESYAKPLALPVDALRRESMAARLRAFGPPPYVAVTWRGGLLPDEPKPAGMPYWSKDIPVELLGQTLRACDARIVVLQRRPTSRDLAAFTASLGRPALDMSAANDDLRDALALLSLADEYVGVSNTNVHLRAGLEGRSARVLVLTPPEWRWGLEGPSSPWFPHFSVYRAALGRDWSAALVGLKRDLAAALQQI